MAKSSKEDVLLNVTVELNTMLGRLSSHYNQSEYNDGLEEYEKIESYLKSSLSEYDPNFSYVE